MTDSPRPDRPPHDLVVSIINFRTAEMTIACVRSVLENRDGLDVHVAVVDNRSDDGSAEAVEAFAATLGPDAPVSVIRSATNSGYSGGHNQGFAAAPAFAYLILNSDALVRPGALGALVAAMRASPRLGLLAPRLEHEDGVPQISAFRRHSPVSELTRAAQFGPLSRLLGRWQVALPVDPDPAAIDWVSFACVLVRAEMIRAIGPMDEGYFLYFEDEDYCLRARAAGWAVAQAPAARVVHLRGGSAPVKALAAQRRRLPAYWYAARTRFFRKHHGRLGPLAANLMFLVGRGVGLLRALAGKPSAIVARESLDVWTNVLDPLGDRRAPGS